MIICHSFCYNCRERNDCNDFAQDNGKVLPVEVKSGKHYKRHRALAHMMDDPEFGMESALVLDDDALDVEGKLFYAPIYMMMFLERERLPETMICEIGDPIVFPDGK